MFGNPTTITMDEDEPMQTEAIYMSSDDDSTSEYPMSDQCLSGDDEAQFQSINHFVIHPDDTTDEVEVTIFNYDIKITQLCPSATTNLRLQLNKHTHNVSLTTTNYSP